MSRTGLYKDRRIREFRFYAPKIFLEQRDLETSHFEPHASENPNVNIANAWVYSNALESELLCQRVLMAVPLSN